MGIGASTVSHKANGETHLHHAKVHVEFSSSYDPSALTVLGHRRTPIYATNPRGRTILRLFTKSAERQVRDGLPEIYPRLWRWSLTLTGSRDRADDLAQATTLRALEKAKLFQPDTRLDAWLFTMAKRIWLNEMRSQSVRQAGGIVPVEDTPIADPRSETAIETNIFAREVLARLTHLPEAQRVAVMLVYVEGMSYKQAAGILNIPIGTIMSRLSAARARMSEWAEAKVKRHDATH